MARWAATSIARPFAERRCGRGEPCAWRRPLLDFRILPGSCSHQLSTQNQPQLARWYRRKLDLLVTDVRTLAPELLPFLGDMYVWHAKTVMAYLEIELAHHRLSGPRTRAALRALLEIFPEASHDRMSMKLRLASVFGTDWLRLLRKLTGRPDPYQSPLALFNSFPSAALTIVNFGGPIMELMSWRLRPRALQVGPFGLVEECLEVLAVFVGELGGEVFDLRGVDEAHPVGDFLDAGDLQALAVLDRLDVVGGLDERFGGAGVEPGEAPAEALDAELAATEVLAVDVGDLEFAARRGFQVGGDVEHLVVVEIEARHGEVGLAAAPASPRWRARGPWASNATTP